MAVDIKEHLSFPVLLVIFLLILSLMFVFPVLKMIILGAILAYIVKPVSCKIQSKLKYSSVSILIAMIVVLIPLILLFGYITFEISSVISSMLANSSYNGFNESISQMLTYLPLNIDSTSITSSLNTSFKDIATYILDYSVSFVSKFANIIIDLFILLVFLFLKE